MPTPPPGRSTAWVRDAAVWVGLVAAGSGLTAAVVAAHPRLGTSAAPFTGAYRVLVSPASALAPLVAAAVIAAVATGLPDRWGWRPLLFASYVATAAWTVALALVDGGAGLAGPLDRPDGYLHDVAAVHGDPLGYLRHFVRDASSHSSDARAHPPGPVLLLWSLDRLGLHRPLLLGLVIVLIGALAVPLIATAVRSLCHEPAARRLLPALTLAPYAVWVGVSLDAVTLVLGAGALVCAVIGSEPGRRWEWALGAGALLGVASFFAYVAPWLGLSVILVYFVRRRALLIMLAGAALLVPPLLAWAAGFSWFDGATLAGDAFTSVEGQRRSWPAWIPLDLVVVVIACGPLLVTALRKVRRTPGWPFLAGAAAGIGLTALLGLTRGEGERAFLALFPWLLVAAVAPRVRPAERGVAASEPVPLPLLVLTALTGIVLEAVLRSPW